MSRGGPGESDDGAGTIRSEVAPDTRTSELEKRLEAANKTIDILTRRIEDLDAGFGGNVGIFLAAARMEQVIARRTREVESKSLELEMANRELRDLTDNLDRIVRDRTRALEESEGELRSKNEQLDRANRMKMEFISIAAHELRTPLTSMVGYLDLIEEGRFGLLTPQVERPVASVRRNAHRLRRLVDELLDVARIESGRIVLSQKSCSLLEVVVSVVDELRPIADVTKQTLRINADRCLDVRGDPDKLHQIVANLVSNAIRYGPEGGTISLTVDMVPESDGQGQLARVRVRDSGPGIAGEHLERIFEPFSQADPIEHHTSRGPDSAGLGLYIARGLARLHGGDITVDSRLGEFTEFHVVIPAVADDEDPR